VTLVVFSSCVPFGVSGYRGVSAINPNVSTSVLSSVYNCLNQFPTRDTLLEVAAVGTKAPSLLPNPTPTPPDSSRLFEMIEGHFFAQFPFHLPEQQKFETVLEVSKAKQKVMTHMAKMRGKTSQTIVDPGCSSPCSEVNTIDNKRILTLQSSTEPFLPHIP
ncbi:hypothetical protein C0J52_08830, partial [Blattella germanica]